MLEELIEIREHKKEGYLPVVRFGAWRVAVLNYAGRFQHGNITQLERHLLTDETFTLLKGRGILYVADGDADHAGKITALSLKPYRVYNVKQAVWHAIEVSRDASVLITENNDTSRDNSRYIDVTPEQLEQAERFSEESPETRNRMNPMFKRFGELGQMLEDLNREAAAEGEPGLRIHDYVHYMDVRELLQDSTRTLKLSDMEQEAVLSFCFRDTREIRRRAGDWDLYALTRHYFQQMSFRTGNRDTPDDCPTKLDLERFGAYRTAREKQWCGETLQPKEQRLLEETETAVLKAMRGFQP